MKTPPYVRLLGASDSGIAALKKGSLFNIVTKPAEIRELGEDAHKVFLSECRATDMFTLALKTPVEAGLEYKRKFLKAKDCCL